MIRRLPQAKIFIKPLKIMSIICYHSLVHHSTMHILNFKNLRLKYNKFGMALMFLKGFVIIIRSVSLPLLALFFVAQFTQLVFYIFLVEGETEIFHAT